MSDIKMNCSVGVLSPVLRNLLNLTGKCPLEEVDGCMVKHVSYNSSDLAGGHLVSIIVGL